MTRILIADDEELVRQGIRSIIETMPQMTIAGEARTAHEAIRLAAEIAADLVIIEINLPDLSGVEATRAIVRDVPHCQVLILTSEQSEQLMGQVLRAGAHGYILKADGGQELIRAVRALQNQQVYFTSHVSEFLLSRYLQTAFDPWESAARRHLTAREREVIQLLVAGKTKKETAAALQISVKTVETHRARIMGKLKLRGFSELIRYAIRNDIASA